MADMRMDRRRFVALAGAAAAGIVAGGGEARAAAPSGPGASYTFVVAADPHLAENREGEATGAEKFRRVIAAVKGLEPAPDFMLIPGDVHVNVFEELLPEIPVPVYPVAGNHENAESRERLRALLPDVFQGRDFYAFDHKGDRFIGMCNAAAIDHVGHFETESNTPNVGQVEWLEGEFAQLDGYPRTFVFGHVPPEPACKPDPMCLAQNDARWLREQVVRVRPTALFFGHLHQRRWFDFDGVPVYGLRSCNWNFRDEPTGFVQVTAAAEGCDVREIDTA